MKASPVMAELVSSEDDEYEVDYIVDTKIEEVILIVWNIFAATHRPVYLYFFPHTPSCDITSDGRAVFKMNFAILPS